MTTNFLKELAAWSTMLSEKFSTQNTRKSVQQRMVGVVATNTLTTSSRNASMHQRLDGYVENHLQLLDWPV